MNRKSSRLGELLLERMKITEEQLASSLEEQGSTDEKLGTILVRRGYVSEIDVLKTLSNQTGVRIINIDSCKIDKDAVGRISERLARRTGSIPLRYEGERLLVAMSDPLNIFDVEDIEFEAGIKVSAVFALKSQVFDAIEKYMSTRNTEMAADEISRDVSEDKNPSIADKHDGFVNSSPVVKLVNSLIKQAVKMGSSDIHIEPFDENIRVRFRVDGELHEVLNIPMKSHSAIVTRIKVMAGMNIAEKRLPQDGRLELKIDDDAIDLRASVLPTVCGEKIVLRILNRSSFIKSKHELGFTQEDMMILDSIMECQNGIILISGPTGSGKTTTLYAYLHELNKMNKNIITVEDPVEYKIHGINHVQVNLRAGMSFASGLRSILRQDPDIIMIGEIRDEETASMAIRAAITGHLVISTIHTSDAPSTVIRLHDMGIKPFLTAASLRGVVSQRLVRKICPNCRIEYETGKYEMELLKLKESTTVYRGTGCARCYNSGYSGRIGIYEIMKADKNIRDIIYRGGSADELARSAEKNGMTTLKENCRRLVLCGITSVDEYSQVVYKL